MKKKVVVNVIPGPKGGGAELLVRELHKGLSLRQQNSYVIYFDSRGVALRENELCIERGVRNPLNVFYLRAMLARIKRETGAPLIIHAHLTWPFFYVVLATVFMECTLFFTEHSTSNRRRKLPFFWMIERWFYKRYRKIFCITEGVRQSLVSWLRLEQDDDVRVVLNGGRLFSMSARAPLENRKANLVSVGSLYKVKNFHTVVRAIPSLEGMVGSYVIVGEGPEYESLSRTIERNGLSNLVRLVGWSDNVEGYLSDADIMVIPSLWEGFGLVAVEGMSSGLSVVASNVPGLVEVLDASKSFVTLVDNVRSPEAWAYGLKLSIQKLTADGDGKLALEARSQAERFSMDAMIEQYLMFYTNSGVESVVAD